MVSCSNSARAPTPLNTKIAAPNNQQPGYVSFGDRFTRCGRIVSSVTEPARFRVLSCRKSNRQLGGRNQGNEQQNEGRAILRSRWVSVLVWDVLPENFKRGTTDRGQKQAAGPERALVLAPELRTELVPETRKRTCF